MEGEGIQKRRPDYTEKFPVMQTGNRILARCFRITWLACRHLNSDRGDLEAIIQRTGPVRFVKVAILPVRVEISEIFSAEIGGVENAVNQPINLAFRF